MRGEQQSPARHGCGAEATGEAWLLSVARRSLWQGAAGGEARAERAVTSGKHRSSEVRATGSRLASSYHRRGVAVDPHEETSPCLQCKIAGFFTLWSLSRHCFSNRKRFHLISFSLLI